MGFWSNLFGLVKCQHENKRGVYGDEINHAGGKRLMCVDCGQYIDGLIYNATVPAKTIDDYGVWGIDWTYYYHSIDDDSTEFPTLPEGYGFEIAKHDMWSEGYKRYCVRIVDREGNVYAQHGFEENLTRKMAVKSASTAMFVMMKEQEKIRPTLEPKPVEVKDGNNSIELGVYWQDEE